MAMRSQIRASVFVASALAFFLASSPPAKALGWEVDIDSPTAHEAFSAGDDVFVEGSVTNMYGEPLGRIEIEAFNDEIAPNVETVVGGPGWTYNTDDPDSPGHSKIQAPTIFDSQHRLVEVTILVKVYSNMQLVDTASVKI